MIIKFSDADIKKCEKFASEVNTSFYASRGQFNAEKRKLDSQIGKMGELAVYYYFTDKEIEVSKPDTKIYKKAEKSWDHDIIGKDFNLHCKSQNISQGLRYGTSWIFENTDKAIFKNIQDNDYVSFISVDLENKTADIKAIIKLTDLHKFSCFKKPKLDYLITKSAVYFDDLKTLPKEVLWQL